jgi:hypothetical protein
MFESILNEGPIVLLGFIILMIPANIFLERSKEVERSLRFKEGVHLGNENI